MPRRCAGWSSPPASAAPHAHGRLRRDRVSPPAPSKPCVVPRSPRAGIAQPCHAPAKRCSQRISPPNVGQASGVCLAFGRHGAKLLSTTLPAGLLDLHLVPANHLLHGLNSLSALGPDNNLLPKPGALLDDRHLSGL